MHEHASFVQLIMCLHFPDMFQALDKEPVPEPGVTILALFVNCDCECFIVRLYSAEILGCLDLKATFHFSAYIGIARVCFARL